MPNEKRPDEKHREEAKPADPQKIDTEGDNSTAPEIAIELPVEEGDANAQPG